MLQTFPVQDLSRISARLHAEFSDLSSRCVERCVSDTWYCVEHLGIPVTPHLVERVAREHLEAMVNSVPPPPAVKTHPQSGNLVTSRQALPAQS